MNKRPLRVLLVEDDADDFLLTSNLLGEITTFEFENEWAATYAAGKEAIAEKSFDICLIDYQLGERTGLDLMREATASGFRAPMILLTEQDDRAVDIEAMNAGAADYLIKGKFEAALLERSIRYALERRRAEDALAAAAKRERVIIENALDVICTIDAEGRFVTVNPACFRLWGYQPEELVGRRFLDFVAPEDREKTAAADASITAGEETTNFENRYLHKNGNLVNVRWTSHWSESEQLVIAVAHDITDRMKIEADLQDSETRYRQLFESNPNPILVYDVQTLEFLAVNEQATRHYGYSHEEFQRMTIRDIRPPQELEALQKMVAQADAGVTEFLSVRHQKKDGAIIEVEVAAQPINFAGRRARLSLITDVTERRRAEAALRESEYKFRTLLESMHEGLLQVDPEDRVQFVNDCFCEMVGYASDELMGTDWSHLVFDDDGQDFIKQVNRRRREGVSDSYEICLRKKSGEPLWVIVGGAPILDAGGAVTGSMGVFTDITERKNAEKQMLHDAFHDGLTGLANRTLFTNHLQMTIERTKRDRSELFAVLFLDFDRFKVINDSLGHAEGDNLLKQIARRLESSLRSGDLVARLGGDEFTVLINKLSDSSVALRVADRIQKNLEMPFEIGGGSVFMSASIGIALSTTGHDRAEDMVRDADIAMYRAKAKGKAQHQVFDQTMHDQASRQLQLETEMRRALEQAEFLLHFQPIVNLENESLIGFESLVRWRHATRGMIPPFEFIGAAEENGLILPLGAWILRESCRQLCEWQKANQAASALTMSVNLSSKQFLQPDLAEQIAAALKATGLDPRCLKLEITESHIMDHTETAVATMTNLRALGVELSLDDFGTGYSSLSNLHRLPVNYLKIDRSFVARMIESEENSEIVSTIIKLAQNLKMKVVAEGIETAEQLARLKILNCEYGQGYFFAKPMEAEAAEMFINKSLENQANLANQSFSDADSNVR